MTNVDTPPASIALDDLVPRAAADPHRPAFHFVSPGGWMNDPNGLTQRDGLYHLFYQYNPRGAYHGAILWGHAVSADLVTWRDEPVALTPDEDGPDAEGCWSGVLVDDDGSPTLVYSGHRDGEFEVACLANGSADLREWRKDPANPVIQAPAGLDLVAFRDHCVWRENGRWRQLIGSGIRDVGGTALLYESDDLRTWTFIGPLATGDISGALAGGPPGSAEWTGSVWECVDFFRLSPDGTSGPPAAGRETDVHVLLFSAWADDPYHALYLTGTYAGNTFSPAGLHRFDLGERACYAPQSFVDSAGRRIVFGWIQEERNEAAFRAAGWAGAMSLPRVMTLVGDTPSVQPAPEVAALRRDHHAFVATAGRRTLTPGDRITGPDGDQLDLEFDITLPPAGSAQVRVRTCPDGTERTTIELHRAVGGDHATIRLDRSASSMDAAADKSERTGVIPTDADGRIRLRVIIDHSVLEIFANGQALTARIYPTCHDALATDLAVPAGDEAAPVCVERFEAWTVDSIWKQGRQLWPESD